MSMRTILVAVLALICGISAAVGISQLRQRGAIPTEETIAVVTAASDVPRGQLLDEKTVKIRRYGKANCPKGVLTNVSDAVGRTTMMPLGDGEPILDGKLTDRNGGRGLAAMVPPGMRAFTIQTAHVAADVGGFILPGNHVDVLLTTTTSNSDEAAGGVTTTLLQNVQVLAVAQKLDAPSENKIDHNEVKSVTLLVNPDQAAKLDLGMNKGVLHLSLRNPADEREAVTSPATMASLRYQQEKPSRLANLWRQWVGPATQATAAPREAGGKQSGKTVAVPPPPEKLQEAFAEIRTLRGGEPGTVRVPLPR